MEEGADFCENEILVDEIGLTNKIMKGQNFPSLEAIRFPPSDQKEKCPVTGSERR